MTVPFSYRNPDGSLNLEAALGPHLRHYVGIMISGEFGGNTQVRSQGGGLTQYGLLVRLGYGSPTRASACGTVAVQPSFSWDVCAYYLRLGVHWRATKKELRHAFLALDPRRENELLCYALSQLLDDVIRSAYDRTELGGIFLWDRDVMAQIRRVASREAGRRMADGEEASTTDVMDEMGFRETSRQEAYDEAAQLGRPEAQPEPPPSRWGQQWGHYLLAGAQGVPEADPALLEAWQGMVATALRERGIAMNFAVGQGGEDAPAVLRNINEACIFIVTEEGASPEKARSAVEMGISLGIVTDNSAGGF